MEEHNVLKRIVFIAIVIYFLDIIFLGSGTLTKIGGISTRIGFFCVAIIASVPGLLKNYKRYIKNKYCISIGIFMFFVIVAMALGIVNGNNRSIMISDFKGFLNILIVFPMMYALDRKEEIEKLLKIIIGSLVLMSFIAIILSFYIQMPVNIQSILYGFLNDNTLCALAGLTENVTRVFFHTAGRWFFVAFMFLLTFSILKENKKTFTEMSLALLMSACFISYTRSIYFAIFICLIVFIFAVIFIFKKYAKQYAKSVVKMTIMTMAMILVIGGLQRENLIVVAVSRCLLSTQRTETIQVAQEKETVEKAEELNENSKTENDGEILSNIESEKTNLDVRSSRKENAINNFKKSPIWGNGFGVVNDIEGRPIEYFYFDLLSKMGILGCMAFLTPFCMSVFDLINFKKKFSDEKRLLLFSAIISVLFLLIISYFNPCMNTTVGLAIYALLIAIVNLKEHDIV